MGIGWIALAQRVTATAASADRTHSYSPTEQPPVTFTHVPAALHAAVTDPSGEHASVVVQDDPLSVEPQTIAQEEGIQLAPPLTGTPEGAPAHVLAAAVQI
jgi:hypothetical protein